MERIKSLNRYQKCILILMLVMTITFGVLYSVTTSRVGFAYQGAILVVSQENGNTIYSGKINWEPACFTVSADKTVVFQYGEKTYGPYTAREDPTAIPKDNGFIEYMTGVEILRGNSVFFRGGVLKTINGYWLYNADGITYSYVNYDGIARDENGALLDPMAPSAATIFTLMHDPQLTHKGQWLAWFGGVLLCVLNAFSMLFEDELFRWNMAFRIRYADEAEPSDWEIAGRYICCTILVIVALAVFVLGLQ